MIKYLNQIELFNHLSSDTLNKIQKVSHIIDVKEKTMLLSFRESADKIYIQLEGKSIEYVLTQNGKRKILFVLGKGSLLNGYVFNQMNSSIYCETIEKSKILVISVNDFTQLMAEDFELMKNVLIYQEKKFGRLSHQLKNTTSSISMEKKLLAKLWKLSKDFGIKTSEGIEIDVNLSITFLADMLGTSRETTSRLCSDLLDNGYIKIHKKRFIILNPEIIAASYKEESLSYIK